MRPKFENFDFLRDCQVIKTFFDYHQAKTPKIVF